MSDDVKDVFGQWLADKDHARIAMFFRNNPGVVESLEGLAIRLGTNVNAIRNAIQNHVALGLLQEHKVGTQVVLRYSQKAHLELEQRIIAELGRRTE